MTGIATTHLFDMHIDVDPGYVDTGFGHLGTRLVASITGGAFAGERLKGVVLPGGGDWLLNRTDGVTQLDVRLALRTDDGAAIYMFYRGYRHGPARVLERLANGEEVDPSEYYQRAAPFYETGDERYAWLTRTVSIATGWRRPDGPSYRVFEVL